MDLEKVIIERDLVVFDLETTGMSIKTDRIVQFAGVRISADGRGRRRLVRLVNPGVPIPSAASAVHGITDRRVRRAKTFTELSEQLEAFFDGADIAGYNVLSFDVPLLRAEFERCGRTFTLVGRRVIDGLMIFKHYERRDLVAALKFYCGLEHRRAHDAYEDVRATIEVIQAQLDKYPDLPRTLAGLDRVSRGRRVTTDGGLVWRDGEACFGFGTYAGVPLRELVGEHGDYLEQVLEGEFSEEVKEVVARALTQGMYPSR